MKFSTSKENIQEALQLISGVVERKQTLPILSHVLLELDQNTLTLSGTDLEIELNIKINVEGEISGTATVSAKKILDIIRSLNPEALVKVNGDNKSKVLVTSGKSKFSLGFLKSEDFPKVKVDDKQVYFKLKSTLVSSLLNKTMFSMAVQDVRYYLNGMLLEIEGNTLNVVATDGHRLAIDSKDQEVNFGDKKQVIIPRKTVIELIKLLTSTEDEISFGLSENHLSVSDNSKIMISKLIDGRYPDYQRVIPDNVEKVAIFSKDKLKNSLMRAAILSNEKYHGIRMKFSSGVVNIFANNPEQEEAHDEVEVDYSGDEVEIGFNVSYLLDVINVIDSEKLKFIFNDGNSSCIIQNIESEYPTYVVMPMRL